MLIPSIFLAGDYPKDREDRQWARNLGFNESGPNNLHRDLVFNDLWNEQALCAHKHDTVRGPAGLSS